MVSEKSKKSTMKKSSSIFLNFFIVKIFFFTYSLSVFRPLPSLKTVFTFEITMPWYISETHGPRTKWWYCLSNLSKKTRISWFYQPLGFCWIGKFQIHRWTLQGIACAEKIFASSAVCTQTSAAYLYIIPKHQMHFFYTSTTCFFIFVDSGFYFSRFAR